jgi:hypothetical protein
MLFLPEQEMHELGLLFYHYLTRKSGLRTYYLGQCVPHGDLISVFKTHSPDILLTSVTSSISPSLESYIDRLAQDFPSVKILMSGIQVREFQGSKIKNVQTFSSALDLLKFL